MGRVSLVTVDAMRISVCGMARPTVLTRMSMESPASLMVQTGEVSVWP
jgi:hypothetical protein